MNLAARAINGQISAAGSPDVYFISKDREYAAIDQKALHLPPTLVGGLVFGHFWDDAKGI